MTTRPGKGHSLKNLQGRRFGRLVVLERAPSKVGNRGARWLCACDCGGTTVSRGDGLQSGSTTSCGCKLRERVTTHGLSRDQNGRKTAEFEIWRNMRRRCYDETHIAFKYYGARGISVCDRWRNDFSAFLADMGKRPSRRHSIDRIDNEAGYSPENCRWATTQEQARNRRSTRAITVGGDTMCISAWAARTGLDKTVIRCRLERGWTPEEAVSSTRRGARK